MTTSLSPFQVACPSCGAEYPVDPDRVPPEGVHAVCSACLRTFPVEAPAESPDSRRETWAPEEPGEAWTPPPPETPHDVGPEGEVAVEEPEGAPEAPAAEPEGIQEAPAAEPQGIREAPAAEQEGIPEAAAAETETEPEARADADLASSDLTGLADEVLSEWSDTDDAQEAAGTAALSRGAARFGRRDPHDRARRLARVLVSDIIAYFPDKHARAVEAGTVKEDFEEEVRKSWKEYVDQVGEEIAESTLYFTDALNSVLARGREIY